MSPNVSRRFAVCLLAAGLLSSPLPAQQPPDQLIELKAEGARVFAASRSQALTGPAASPVEAVRSFLASRGKSPRAVASLVTVSQSTTPAGLTHLRFRQVVNGLDVYGAYAKATTNARNELTHLIEILPEPPALVVASNVRAQAALDAALRELYPGRSFTFTELPAQANTISFEPAGNFFFRNPSVTRVALPLASGAMQEGWLVETWTREDNQLHHTVVGNGARILNIEVRTANESYNIFAEHPTFTVSGSTRGAAQTIVQGPGSAGTESQNGWISADGRTAGAQYQFRMSGNNVYAYLDADANNSPDAAGALISGTNFTVSANLADAPTTSQNRQVAIQNLFWANNVIHDQLYKHGFNESAGNFQQNNFGKGGAGNDSVLAEAQDGSGTNNANFSTPADGSSPRMQMFLWNRTTPNRDGDVDTDIVYHEYGHGLTWRMIGSMSGCMSGAIGEGASDTLAILMNQDDVVGEYSYNTLNGIRRYPYTNYPLTYGQLTNEGVHAGGELFAAIMWKAKSYLTTDDTWKYLVDGMNYIPAGPKFENMRDGIVQAAGGLNADGCKIYQAFADFGVGQGASGSCTTKGFIFTTTTWNVSQSFTVPAACQSALNDVAVTAVNAPASVAPGSSNNISVTVKNVGNQVASAFSVTLNGTSHTEPVPAGLAAGASASRTFSWTAPASTGTTTVTGGHTYPDDVASNNTLERSINVAATTSITLTVAVRSSKGSKYAQLTWSPSGQTTYVDVHRNATVLPGIPNNGLYTDVTQPKNTTATYKVCTSEPAPVCSNQVTVSF